MNKLNIGERILRLRKEKNITQEQLASMVGVSAGAVSKWETGNSTPDIFLLSPLARALNTSVDILLSFQQELSEEDALNIKRELEQIFFHESYEAGETKCRSYLKEYPNSIYLKYIVAGLIQMYSCMSGNLSEEFIKEKLRYSLNLYQEVAESKEPKYAPVALFCIASIQMSLENYEESEKALKALPQSQINPMTLYPTLYLRQGKNQKAAKLCSSQLMQHINNSSLELSTLSKIAIEQKDYDKAFFYLETAYKLQNMFKAGMHSAEYNLCRLYIKLDKKDEAAKWFKNYVEGILSAEYDYSNNPYFNSIELEVKPDGQKAIRKNLFKSLILEDDVKVLTGIPEYEMSIEMLKNAISEM